MTTPELLSDADLAQAFDAPEKTIANWRRRYDWPHVLVGQTIRYTPEHVEQILRRHEVTAPANAPTALPGQTRRSASRARSA